MRLLWDGRPALCAVRQDSFIPFHAPRTRMRALDRLFRKDPRIHKSHAGDKSLLLKVSHRKNTSMSNDGLPSTPASVVPVGESKVLFSTTRADLVKALHQPFSRRPHPSSSVPRHMPVCLSPLLRTRAAVQAVLREAGTLSHPRIFVHGD